MYELRVSEITAQPNNNVTIKFDDIHGDYPAYKAGQFLTLIFHFNNREVRRSYSFNSSPLIKEPMSITVKRVDNGEISRLVHHKLIVGDNLSVLEPQGIFTYIPELNRARTVVLFAAGVGITPLYSILKTALVGEEHSKVILVYSNSSIKQTVFYDELKEWEKKYPERLKIVWIFSSSKYLLTARLNRDYILEILKNYTPERSDIIFYTCGPVFYMDLCRFTLLGMGYDNDLIKRETFQLPENDEDDDDESVPIVDTTSYRVKLRYKGDEYPLFIPYNKTILDVALEHKINIPYSCKSGMCSTCISQCVEGSVRMDYNEVLTDREVENGKCLVCTSHPLENDTIIEVQE